MRSHKHSVQLILMSILLFAFTLFALYHQNFEIVFVGVLMLFLSLLPLYLKSTINLHIPTIFIYTGIIFIFLSLFLGQFSGFYDRFHWYDAFLHFISAIIIGFIGFIILFAYSIKHKLQPQKSIILFFVFFFCLGVGALWEIFEYGVDAHFNTNMQVGSLDDTMIDLIVTGIGALISSILCALYMSKMVVPVIDSVVDAVTNEVIEENNRMLNADT